MSAALVERIAEKFAFDPDGCWRWTGRIRENGYADIYVDGRLQRAHRVMYRLLVGPIPEGLDLDHLCRVRHCVNPSHLEPVTNKENLMRGEGPSAQAARRTHCVHGHPFDAENTRINKDGHRCCRACDREKGLRRRDALARLAEMEQA